ncbi:hypothetical protein NLU13_5844 [Sarocladium strictum]|uniref:T6SS Phospholipase effector Tle1-like catalytic domain-containing protein n=1 Tax=Sarocladium strictum TaxID=5046 RepID=A0AA39GH62_SARSR|nr:hypothetical protein NLU13_5844 [Sarocladium strictum]
MDPTHLDPSSAARQERPHDAPMGGLRGARINSPGPAPSRGIRKLILCFDGTGNKFHGDDSDSNILKIFRMLDREADDQYHYYQPGIGTYVVSGSLSHTSVRARFNSWYQKGKDSAVGSSFDQHVVGGYRFLMRFYNPGDEIYMFGFSRGSYIARFLAEMIDHIGLLSHGNEEMVKFAWKAFAQWQSRQMNSSDGEQAEKDRETQREMYRFMKGFRETFSRPVGRIQFLGLFDTVNSVPRFETAWMQRSKFPYTAKSSAKVIRHAVSIDERRAKFRQDLMYQSHPRRQKHHHRKLGELLDIRRSLSITRSREDLAPKDRNAHEDEPKNETGKAEPIAERGRQPSGDGHLQKGPKGKPLKKTRSQKWDHETGRYKPYRARSRSCQRVQFGDGAESDNGSTLSGIGVADVVAEDDDEEQDIDEVWFAGGHGDVGGGWEALDDRKSSSHVPLVWMVREAIQAGLPFDPEKVAELGCGVRTELRKLAMEKKSSSSRIPDIRVQNGLEESSPTWEKSRPNLADDNCEHFHGLVSQAHTSPIHDSLLYGGGLSFLQVTAWKFMEWMPFRRMDLKADGSWEPIRWPLPRGEVRDIPENARVHGSVIRRMKEDETYRPGNLIIGGGGRGVRVAPARWGIGEWECVQELGDPVGEIWMRKGCRTSGDKKEQS